MEDYSNSNPKPTDVTFIFVVESDLVELPSFFEGRGVLSGHCLMKWGTDNELQQLAKIIESHYNE
ncbi:MAG: hypothetical protein KAR64_02220 [Thermoplasmatales archaeon]|nr:hypothetical protein [Thermoplasmatales archaeon]